MTSEYLLNTGPELLEDISSCVTAYGRPEIAEGPRDGLNLIRNKLRPMIPEVSGVSVRNSR